MKSDVVATMDEECLTRPYPTGKRHSIGNILMGMMVGSIAKGVDHKGVNIVQKFHLTLVNGLHVRDIRQFADTECRDGQLAVIHHERDYRQLVHLHFFVMLQSKKVYLRRTRIAMLRKAIWDGMHQGIGRDIVGIDIHLAELTERAQVVYTARMVVVDMRQQHRVNLADGSRDRCL